jgi:hypothetical protein
MSAHDLTNDSEIGSYTPQLITKIHDKGRNVHMKIDASGAQVEKNAHDLADFNGKDVPIGLSQPMNGRNGGCMLTLYQSSRMTFLSVTSMLTSRKI